MKKFIIFALVLIVTVSLGVTTYYFIRDNEELVVNCGPTIYVNEGDTFIIDADLKYAKINNVILTSIEAGEDVIEQGVSYNADNLEFTANKGGQALIKLKTNNDRISPKYITVNVGDGKQETPYYISSKDQLSMLNESSGAHFFLTSDITLSENFTPLCGDGFTGSFNGNGKTIYNLKINGNYENAGFIAKLNKDGVIKNLNLSNVTIEGQSDNVGAFVGVNNGTISRCEVLSGMIKTDKLGETNIGGIAGFNGAKIDRCASKISVGGTKYVGGLVGQNKAGLIINSYSYSNQSEVVALADNSILGGLVGLNASDGVNVAVIKNCYAVLGIKENGCSNVKKASVIGQNKDFSKDTPNNLIGLYAESTLDVSNNDIQTIYVDSSSKNYINFRGLENSFPKEKGKINYKNLKSFVSSIDDNIKFWDFVNVWQIDEEVNNGYPSLRKNGASVPDEIELISNPSDIKDETDFRNFIESVNNGTADKYYKLVNDIELTMDVSPIGTIVNKFDGTFNGNGKTISNIKITSNTLSINNIEVAGLFGYVGQNSQILNLTVKNVTIEKGALIVGAVAGYNEGKIENVRVLQDELNTSVNNIIGGKIVGGVVGQNRGTILNCEVKNQSIKLSANTDTLRFVGGIAGMSGSESNLIQNPITNCKVNSCYIYDDAEKEDYDFDLSKIGFEAIKSINRESNQTYQCLVNTRCYVAGLVGANYSLIANCDVESNTIKTNVYLSLSGASGAIGLLEASTDNSKVENISVYNCLIEGFTADGLCKKQSGVIEYCEVNDCTIRGVLASGLTTLLANNGRLRYSVSNSFLTSPSNASSKGILSGMVTYSTMSGYTGIKVTFDKNGDVASVKNKTYGEFCHIFSSCIFDKNVKTAYYDSAVDYVYYTTGFNVINKTAGFGNNLCWVKTDDTTENRIRQKTIFGGYSGFKLYEIGADEVETSNWESEINFDETKWLFTNGYPKLFK